MFQSHTKFPLQKTIFWTDLFRSVNPPQQQLDNCFWGGVKLSDIPYEAGQDHKRSVKEDVNKSVLRPELDTAARDRYLATKYRGPGQLGAGARRKADNGSDMESGYSSHRESKDTSPAPSVYSLEGEPYLHPDPAHQEEGERVWLVCQSGVMPARLVQEPPRARVPCDDIPSRSRDDEDCVTIQLEDTQELLRVNKKFIEKAGSEAGGLPEDLRELEHCNESSLVSALAARFQAGRHQTWLGDHCTVTINPMRQAGPGSGDFCHDTDKVLQQAEEVYRAAVNSLSTQSMVFTGRSGAGKTSSFKKVLEYLVDTTQGDADTAVFTTEKMRAVDCLLESFCSTRTVLNTHATRTAQLVQLYYARDGGLMGGELQMALPDAARLVRSGRRPGEPTFPVFYQVQAALGKSSLYLPPRELVSNAFFTPLQDEVEVLAALEDWSRVCVAMEVLGVDRQEEEVFWLVIAAITDLGVMARQMEESGSQDCDPAVVAKVAEILGVTRDELLKVISRPATPRTSSPASSLAPSTQVSRASSPGLAPAASTASAAPLLDAGCPLVQDNIQRLAVTLYTELLSRLVSLINRSIQPYHKHAAAVILFDSPGFQNPNSIGEQPAAGFVDLCYNYLQERLQKLFIESQLEKLSEKEKEIAKLVIAKKTTSAPLINLIDRTGSVQEQPHSSWAPGSRCHTLGRRRSSSRRVRWGGAAARPGLLTLLHRAASCPWSDDRTFVHRLHGHWGPGRDGSLMEKEGELEFTLQHLQGTAPVRYSAAGWRHLAYSMGRTNLAAEILSKSDKSNLRSNTCDPFNHFGFGHVGEALSLEDVKSKMSCLQVKVQVDTIVRVLAASSLHWVVCLQPHPLAGLCELFRRPPGRSVSQKLLRDQVRGLQLLDHLQFLAELARVKQIVAGRREALGQLASEFSASVVVSTEEGHKQPGLASSLWHGLQLAVASAVTNLDLIEQVATQLQPPASTLPRLPGLLDEAGVLLLRDGRVILGQL